MRTDPPVSLPMPIGASPAATATAVPLDDPPGTRWRSRSQGFHGVPIIRLVPHAPRANSTMWVLPSGIMPAPSNRSTVALVVSATRAAHIRDPTVPTRPAMSHRSFTAIGRPCSGPSGNRAVRALSAASASARASSA